MAVDQLVTVDTHNSGKDQIVMQGIRIMRGKVCLVTGANDGIGKATALGLAKMGATVVMVCRDAAKGQAALAEIRQASGNPSIELLVADLSSQAAIHKLVDEFKQNHNQLHVLINNAGVNVLVRTLTADSVELNFAVNHLAPFMLTLLLLDVLKASAPARIVNVNSAAQGFGIIHFDDLMLAEKYDSMRGYAQSKLANILFGYELARRLAGTDVTVNCFNPWLAKTKIAQGMGGFFGLMARVLRPFAATPEKAAETAIYLATSSEVEGVSGKYFENKREKMSSKASYDLDLAKRLWDVSAELVHLESLP
jgi:NAD(P)-dependent dehydrogenase (short-subunit alcohol dehydrogenase family)